MTAEVLIVGGGLAGLACARTLHAAGLDVRVLEAEDEVGGRVRTDEVDGFLLDRGFQVLLTAYPEARLRLDYRALGLRPFLPGADVRFDGGFRRLSDPWRRPSTALSGLLSPVGTLGDKLRMARLRGRLLRSSVDEILHRPETSTRTALRREGFSDGFVDAFLGPFLSGVFLDEELETSSRMFELVLKMFGEGDAALPAHGMGSIARQLARPLPEGAVRTGVRVAALDGGALVLEDGSRLEAEAVVVAAPAPWLAAMVPSFAPAGWRSVLCYYWSAPEPPVRDPILVLRGDERGPVNNLCVPSRVCPSYAPPGETLVSATVLGAARAASGDPRRLERDVRRQLRGWFGGAVDAWRPLRVYDVRRALPARAAGTLEPACRPVRAGERVWVCGDHRDNPSIQGALASGRRAAEDLLDSLGAVAA